MAYCLGMYTRVCVRTCVCVYVCHMYSLHLPQLMSCSESPIIHMLCTGSAKSCASAMSGSGEGFVPRPSSPHTIASTSTCCQKLDVYKCLYMCKVSNGACVDVYSIVVFMHN